MVRDAEAHAEEDKREKEKAEVRNEADTMIYTTEKTLKDLGDKVSPTDKSAIEAAIVALRKSLEGTDLADIKAKTETLKQASYKIAEEMYKNTASQQQGQPGEGGAGQGFDGSSGAGAGPEASSSNNTKNAEDVDYEVVHDDDEKKK